MKVNEVFNIPLSYLAVVRIVFNNSSSIVRTRIAADSLPQAKLMLTSIYGEGNILNINQVISEGGGQSEAAKTL